MHVLDTANMVWRIGKKTRPVRAKPMVTLLVDKTVMARFLVDTLEAREPVSANAMLCIGESNDAWQQTPEKLLKQYDVTSIDAEGWMVCHPKPENSREFFEVTKELLVARGAWEDYVANGLGYVQGQWGETVGEHTNLQRFVLGDRVARNRDDLTDQWVVRQKIWRATYVELSSGADA